ncbi:ribosome biogenesis GTPase Der [Neolewinella lacunae]|uniref:GTPase Der n=1 Tax=Neolewinella lacunae TaxID=1517758 RepID=A0A923T8M9_9BACT|nr:ribosome biogenesis GTPase Der [Neolewinella lacunae]MBC6995800.1 ribosome biogenesis GTPase Der [Neolewinella lacunae]MDN3636507.1 ribosome biogenesis GTPase Der [Neolewinella lacunae]
MDIVAIVGRPNVGKSTLFNRLIGEKQSIVDNVSGVTRDRQYGQSNWNGKEFAVVDTGGFVRNSEDVFEAAIRDQVQIAIDEATVILFMVDVSTGLTDLDEQVAHLLRRAKKPVVLAVNKVDNHTRQLEANEFWSLGFEETFFLSSVTGSGTGELLDAVVEHVENREEPERTIPHVAVVGQPNAGKSSFINALLGEERNIVTDIAGTTRDSIHSHYNKYEREFMLIDTAGIRKKAKVYENLEFYSVMRAIRAIEESDVVVLIVDATDGVEGQDLAIFRIAQKRNKGIVVAINKWDLVLDKETNTARDYELKVRERFAPFNDLPIIFMSVLEKQRIMKVVDATMQVYENRTRRIPTSQLNDVMQAAMERYSPPNYRGKEISIKYVVQLPLAYPAFAFYCNHPQHINDSYKNYLENQIRANFEFSGVPISIFFRKK